MANSWKTRTGSLALSTVTALFNRIVLVLAAAAANSTAGAESRGRSVGVAPAGPG